MEKLNLYQKIQAVANDIMNIEKDMTVGKGSYAYKAVSEKEVTLQVKRAEAKNKLLSIPITQELISSEVHKVRNGDKESLVHIDNIKMTLRIVDIDTPTDFIEVTSFGKGIDNGDKGFGKASTYARKYALLNAYKIATGEDPDAEKSKDVNPLSIDERKAAIIDVCLKDETTKTNILKHFGIASIEELSEKDTHTVYNQFKTRGRI